MTAPYRLNNIDPVKRPYICAWVAGRGSEVRFEGNQMLIEHPPRGFKGYLQKLMGKPLSEFATHVEHTEGV